MTKIWCAICNEADFGVFPPTKQHVLDHIRLAHGLDVTINTDGGRELWSQAQDAKWKKRGKKLEQLLNHYSRTTTWQKGDNSKGEPDEDILEDLQRKWKRHMEVFDDATIECDAAGNGPLIALNAGGSGYRTIAHRSSQIATAVEQVSPAGEHQQMFVRPAAHGAGWNRMAESSFEPIYEHESGHGRHGRSQGANEAESTRYIDRSEESVVMYDAANTLLLMGNSQQDMVERPQTGIYPDF